MVMTTEQLPTFEAVSYNSLARGRRADPRLFYSPLPPELVGLLPKAKVTAHQRLAERTTKALETARVAEAAIADAEARDQRELVDAARDGRKPAQPTVPEAELKAEQAQQAAAAHQEAIAESANELLELAAPKLADTAERVRRSRSAPHATGSRSCSPRPPRPAGARTSSSTSSPGFAAPPAKRAPSRSGPAPPGPVRSTPASRRRSSPARSSR